MSELLSYLITHLCRHKLVGVHDSLLKLSNATVVLICHPMLKKSQLVMSVMHDIRNFHKVFLYLNLLESKYNIPHGLASLKVINPFISSVTLANSAYPDQTPQNTASDLDMHCLYKANGFFYFKLN